VRSGHAPERPPHRVRVRRDRQPPRPADRRSRRRPVPVRGRRLGTLVTSQVSPGAKNSFRIRLDGSEGSLSWDQERPEELWLGRQGGPTELRHKSAGQLHEPAERRAHLPAGEIEGWNTTFVNLFASVYRRILGQPAPGDELVATLSDGLLLMRVIDAVIRSDTERAWVEISCRAVGSP
jgi:predicted dehydrogenase